jgi:hypothetical protein
MKDLLNIKNTEKFLGGTNAHALLILVGLGAIVYKLK